METVIIRSTFVFGKNVKSNFTILLDLARFITPLYFISIQNKRCLESAENFADIIFVFLNYPKAKNQIFLVGVN